MCEVARAVQSIEIETRRMVARAWVKDLVGNLCVRDRVSVWEDEEHSGDGWW